MTSKPFAKFDLQPVQCSETRDLLVSEEEYREAGLNTQWTPVAQQTVMIGNYDFKANFDRATHDLQELELAETNNLVR